MIKSQVYTFQKSLPSFSTLLKWGFAYRLKIQKAISNESDDLLNDTVNSSPPPQAEEAVSWIGHFSAVTP